MSQSRFASLDEFFTQLENFHGGYDSFVDNFMRLTPDNRIGELKAFDQLLELETAPSRQTAEYIQRRRQLGDVHELLKRGGR